MVRGDNRIPMYLDGVKNGLTVTAAHLVLIPHPGTRINPSRYQWQKKRASSRSSVRHGWAKGKEGRVMPREQIT